jgi:hypothetical protein
VAGQVEHEHAPPLDERGGHLVPVGADTAEPVDEDERGAGATYPPPHRDATYRLEPLVESAQPEQVIASIGRTAYP